MNILAMSVYGDDPKYIEGAAANAKLMADVYPGWKMMIFMDRPIRDLVLLSSDTIACFDMKESRGHEGMFWRFLAYDAEGAKTVIFRDADSRIGPKEAAAVNAWIESDKALHVMRDHADHAFWPILGGMWGLKKPALNGKPMRALTEAWSPRENKLDDMRFLAGVIWPMFNANCLQHSSVESPHGGEPFPSYNDEGQAGHVGQIIEVTQDDRQ